MAKTKDDFSSDNEVQSNWVKFNVSAADDPENCDKVFGTLINKRQVKSQMPDKAGELVWVYEMLMEYGQFHELDEKKKVIEEPIVVEKGSIYNIGGKAVIDRQMQNIKIGQMIGLKFIEEQEAKQKGYNPAKVIKVYAPKNDDGTQKMNEEWLKEQAEQDDLMQD